MRKEKLVREASHVGSKKNAARSGPSPSLDTSMFSLIAPSIHLRFGENLISTMISPAVFIVLL